jgi:signal transduction histidine kinase
VKDNLLAESGSSSTPVDPQDDAVRELHALRVEIAELRASRRRLALTADAERRRIERALHEGVQQLLVALAADVEFAAASVDTDPAVAGKILAEVRQDVRQVLEETRKLAHRIYPPLLEAAGLVAALRAAAVGADVKTKIDVAAGATFQPEIAGAVYFCCLDVLDRARDGTPVSVSVRDEDGAVAFEIAAECELDAERLAIRDRVEALGGTVTITEGLGRETTVAGWLPLSG